MSSQVVYEVSVSVPSAENAAYAVYMKTDHIPAIMVTGKFDHITMCTSMDNPVDHDWVHYKTAYTAKSEDALQSYISEDAPALRADFMAHCPKDAKVSRRIWKVEQQW